MKLRLVSLAALLIPVALSPGISRHHQWSVMTLLAPRYRSQGHSH